MKNKLTYKQADVLVAHGAIIGSSTSDGFLFEHEFDTKDLFNNYTLYESTCRMDFVSMK